PTLWPQSSPPRPSLRPQSPPRVLRLPSVASPAPPPPEQLTRRVSPPPPGSAPVSPPRPAPPPPAARPRPASSPWLPILSAYAESPVPGRRSAPVSASGQPSLPPRPLPAATWPVRAARLARRAPSRSRFPPDRTPGGFASRVGLARSRPRRSASLFPPLASPVAPVSSHGAWPPPRRSLRRASPPPYGACRARPDILPRR